MTHISPDPTAGFSTGGFDARCFHGRLAHLSADGVRITDHHWWFASEHGMGRWLAFTDARDASVEEGRLAWRHVDPVWFARCAAFAGEDLHDVSHAPISVGQLQRKLLHLMPQDVAGVLRSGSPADADALRAIVEDEIAHQQASVLPILAAEAQA